MDRSVDSSGWLESAGKRNSLPNCLFESEHAVAEALNMYIPIDGTETGSEEGYSDRSGF